MNSSILIILGLFTVTLFFLTILTIFSLIYSSGNKTITDASSNKVLFKERNRRLANKAIKVHLFLQEEYSELKIIKDDEDVDIKKVSVMKIDNNSEILLIDQSERIAV